MAIPAGIGERVERSRRRIFFLSNSIDAPPEVEIPANGSANILLDARTDTPGVHDVTIRVTDTEGNALGGSDELSIRSARVSNIIWLFLATGIGLLFGTIGFRLVRRVRAARR